MTTSESTQPTDVATFIMAPPSRPIIVRNFPKDTCLQCGKTRSEVREAGTGYCFLESGFEGDEWDKHRWQDWPEKVIEANGVLPEYWPLYRRVSVYDFEYIACEHSVDGHNPAEEDLEDLGIHAGDCLRCGMMIIG
jgi:hypothetical protein